MSIFNPYGLSGADPNLLWSATNATTGNSSSTAAGPQQQQQRHQSHFAGVQKQRYREQAWQQAARARDQRKQRKTLSDLNDSSAGQQTKTAPAVAPHAGPSRSNEPPQPIEWQQVQWDRQASSHQSNRTQPSQQPRPLRAEDPVHSDINAALYNQTSFSLPASQRNRPMRDVRANNAQPHSHTSSAIAPHEAMGRLGLGGSQHASNDRQHPVQYLSTPDPPTAQRLKEYEQSFAQRLPKQPRPVADPPALQPSPPSEEDRYYARALALVAQAAHLPLNQQLETLLNALQTTQSVLHRRADVLDRLQSFVDNVYGSARYRDSSQPTSTSASALNQRFVVRPFGSVVLGVDNDASDLDVCIMDQFFPQGCSDSQYKLPEIYNMNNLSKRLERWRPLGKSAEVLPIKGAKVPIVKVKLDNGLSLDINVNEALGHKNTTLLRAYFDILPGGLLSSLARFLKFHFKNRRLNDPSGQNGPSTFSSYSLLLMMVSYFQSIGCLPNLQDDAACASKEQRDLWWLRSKDRKHRVSVRRFDVTFGTQPPPNWKPARAAPDLAEAAFGFFDYFSTFPFDTHIVSIKDGGKMERAVPYRAGRSKGEEREPDVEKKDEPALPETEATGEADGFEMSLSAPGDLDAFDQPEVWRDSYIVTQDPFDILRNTSGAARLNQCRTFISECERARDLIKQGASLAEISAVSPCPQGRPERPQKPGLPPWRSAKNRQALERSQQQSRQPPTKASTSGPEKNQQRGQTNKKARAKKGKAERVRDKQSQGQNPAGLAAGDHSEPSNSQSREAAPSHPD